METIVVGAGQAGLSASYHLTRAERETSLRTVGRKLAIEVDGALLTADNVVVATGAYQKPTAAPLRTAVRDDVLRLHTDDYRRPEQLPEAPSSSSEAVSPAVRSPMSCSRRTGRSISPSDAARGCPAATAGARSSAGPSIPSSWTRPSTRCPPRLPGSRATRRSPGTTEGTIAIHAGSRLAARSSSDVCRSLLFGVGEDAAHVVSHIVGR